MINIIDKAKCSGCSACLQICSKNCITMQPDNEGFIYPKVDNEKCVNCGLCEKICPVINTEFVIKVNYPEAFLIYDKNCEWRKRSAAGGGFGALARSFLKDSKGVVYGAAYDDGYQVHHIRVSTIEELPRVQKSKYVQSVIGNSFQEIKEDLKSDKKVLFSGTPCQIYGLKSYLEEFADSVNLYCIDLSCHGVPSPKVFEKYLKCLEKQERSKISSFTMRDKNFKKCSYDQGFGISFENGSKQFNTHSQDLYGRCFWGEIASRPSCYECHFKTVWRAADITLGDCWFMNCYVPSEQDSQGVTLALTHSNKGKELLTFCENLICYDVPSEELIKANGGMLYSSAVMNPKREEFFARLDSENFKNLVEELLPEKSAGMKQKVLQVIDILGLRLEWLRKKGRRKKLDTRLKRIIPDDRKGIMVISKK